MSKHSQESSTPRDEALTYLTNIANAFDPVEGPVEFEPNTWIRIRNAIYDLAPQSETVPTAHGSAAVTPDPLRTVSAAASTTRERINALLKRLVEDNYEENRIAAANAIGDILDGTLQSATGSSEDAACKVAAVLLRNEIVRLEYPKSMFPQEAEKIGRRQTAFQEAVRFLDPADSEMTKP